MPQWRSSRPSFRRKNGARLIYYDWPYSPFCMKVRAILEYKKLEFDTVSPFSNRGTLTRKGTGKVPAIELDGEFIADSTDIAYALENRFPHPSIIPADPRQRALCHALEDWADESLYFLGLYYRWYELEGRKPIAGVFTKARPVVGRLAYWFYLRRVLGQIRGQGTLRKRPAHVRRDLDRHLEAIEAMLTPGPYLLGKKPSLCDFALWGQLNYLRRTPVGKAAMKDWTAIEEFLRRLAGPPG